MPGWDTVAIVGVGLIGGSIGLALRRRSLARRVIGVGREAARLRIAQQRQAVTDVSTDLAEGVAGAELVVVCTPVAYIAGYVRAAARACPPGAVVTDTGSTKAELCQVLDDFQALDDLGTAGAAFVGSHPLAGSEKSGIEFADADLFVQRLTIVTPTAATSAAATAEVERFWTALGGRVQRMTPAAHDRVVAAISHGPHVIAAALAAATAPEDLALAGPGWCDTTRVAAGDVELWRQILMSNRAHVLQSLADFEKVLADVRHALATDDAGQLLRLLEVGKRHRDTVGN